MGSLVAVASYVVQSLLAGLGIYVSLKPDKERHRFYLWIFVVLWLVGLVLTFVQQRSAVSAQEELKRQLAGLKTGVESIKKDSERPIQLQVQMPPASPSGTESKPHWMKDLPFEVLKPLEPNRVDLNVYSFKGTIQPVRLKLTCDRPLAGVIVRVRMTVNGQDVVNPRWRIANSGKALELGFEGPAMGVVSELRVELHTSGPVNVLYLERWGQ
jgi:hypothetical protein